MSAVKRTKDGIEAYEHAMQGVQTSRDHKIVNLSRESGLIGSRSTVKVDVLDDIPAEREVIVKMPRVPRRRSR
jgi:hypothetical protein